MDVIIIHYQSYCQGDWNIPLIDYLTIITESHIILIEEYMYPLGNFIQRREYEIGKNYHYMIRNNRNGEIQKVDNEQLHPVKVIADSILTIAGYKCHKAIYQMDGYEQKAYFTDVFGVKFSTTANYPGVALYYEKGNARGTWSFLADWVKPMRLSRADLYPFNTKRSTDKMSDSSVFGFPNSRSIMTNNKYKQNTSSSPDSISVTVISATNRSSRATDIRFKDIDGTTRTDSDFNHKIVVFQIVDKLPSSASSPEYTMNVLANKFDEGDVHLVMMTWEKYSKLKDSPLHINPKIDIAVNGKRFLKRRGFDSSTGYLVIDKKKGYAPAYFDLSRPDIQETLTTHIQFLLAEGSIPIKLDNG